ncbi:MAG: DsbE family thiol:disulfide interchange protein [Rhodospirillales bacterium]|nr:DsbE family thiol:disulfide interchange protein [Rhodospirillales bacterium]
MTKRLLFLLPALIFVFVAGYFIWGLVSERDPRAVPSALVDKPVPQFDMPPLEGTGLPGLATADVTDGTVTLVNVFASWCIPCRAEHPQMLELGEMSSIRLVGINFRDKPEDALAWLEELGNPYQRIGVDARGRTAIEWGSSGVPETFFIDKTGKVRYQHIGPILRRDLEETVLPLIEELN